MPQCQVVTMEDMEDMEDIHRQVPRHCCCKPSTSPSPATVAQWRMLRKRPCCISEERAERACGRYVRTKQNGKEWKGMERNGKEWKGMERNGKEWKGMERKQLIDCLRMINPCCSMCFYFLSTKQRTSRLIFDFGHMHIKHICFAQHCKNRISILFFL